MEYKDYYKIMGVEREATQDEIKRAYRKLARKYHPDVSKEPDAETRFKEMGEAYEVLKHPDKRSAYDQLGNDIKSGQEFRPPPNWDQGFEFHGDGADSVNAEQFSEFFESLFGRGGFTHEPSARTRADFHMRGEDSHVKVLIDLEDSYTGATRTLTLKHAETGMDDRPKLKERTLNVRIPKGVKQGQHIRLSKQGAAGIGKGEPGDLYMEIEFNSHNLYHVEGKDVYVDLPVTPWEAELGATIKTPTPAGIVDLKVMPHSSGGRKLRLKGRGIPAKLPGDLYVVLQITLPPATSENAEAAYREFAKALPFNPRKHLGV